jgi:hypothetical protein
MGIDINFVLVVLIQVACVFIFLSVFYFTYAKNKERDTVNAQVDFLIDSFNSTKFQILPNNLKQILLNKVNDINVNTPANAQANKNIDANNNAIKTQVKNIIIKVVVGIILLCIVSVILSKKTELDFFKNLQLLKIFKEVGIIVFFVGVTEFVFLTYFGSKFVSINPHVIKAQIAQNIATIFT